MWRPNVFFGLWLWSLAAFFSGCGAALMTADQIVGPLATIAAAIFTSTALLVAALLAWRSVQARIDLEEANDKRRFRSAVTAELVTFSDPVIRAASDWNARARNNPNEVPAPERWPVLPRPSVYEALVSRIGSIEDRVAFSVIAFYGQVLDLREISTEAMHDRATHDVNVSTLARRFQHMALTLADAIDGLSGNHPFPNTHDTRTLFTPIGLAVATIPFPLPITPLTIQTVLRLLGGRPISPTRPA
jgi:hypothetical protein